MGLCLHKKTEKPFYPGTRLLTHTHTNTIQQYVCTWTTTAWFLWLVPIINVLSCSQQYPTLFVGDVGSLPFHSRPAIPPPFRSQDQSPAVLLCPACFLAVAWAITFKTLRLVTLTGIIYDVPLNRFSREEFFFFLLVSRTDDPRLPPAAATATVTERTKINNYRIFGVYSKWDVAARTSGLNVKLFFFLLKKKILRNSNHCRTLLWSVDSESRS